MVNKIRCVIASITLVAAAVFCAGSEPQVFRAKAAGEYAHQTADKVTVGAKTYDSEELTAEAFGKVNLLKYGVLPVLVVIENKRDKALDLQNIQVELISTDGRHVTSVRAEDLTFLAGNGNKHPSIKPLPMPVPLPKKKNPLSSPDLLIRAFSAKVLAPGDTASGFFYFEAKAESGDSVYLNGLHDARSGQEILYFEFPFQKAQ